MNVDKINKLIIIGSGPAGYTAAIYAARAMLEPILIAGSQPGGQLTITTDVENFPGFADVIQGPWLMEQMKEQALKVGTKFIEDHISTVNFNKKPFEIIGDSGTHYFAESVIISTGAQARWLNLESEEKYKGFGVSACATCDGFFYKNKDVVVVGGGVALVRAASALDNVKGSNDDQDTGINIIRTAIEAPLRTIVSNAGGEPSVVINKIRENKGNYGYNARTDEYMDLFEAGVIDPTKVTRLALENAASIAALLLTTECVVADVKEDAPAMPPMGGGGMGGMM